MTHRVSRRPRRPTGRWAVNLVLAALLGTLSTVSNASAAPPRPGCGYGDDNHAHQAAPGRDPLGLRPGAGSGDDNHEHTAPPGRAPEDGGDQSGPMRGCKPAPAPVA